MTPLRDVRDQSFVVEVVGRNHRARPLYSIRNRDTGELHVPDARFGPAVWSRENDARFRAAALNWRADA